MTERVTLRKYPYPYRSALTICSDIDFTTPEEFLEIHRFLNTQQRTSMGVGVGLEIGDSFWMYSAAPEPWRSLTLFNGLEPVEGPWSEMILDFIRAGYLDCLHTYGDFNHYGGFRREMAVKAVDYLLDKGIQLRIWTNHGDLHNFQSINERLGLGDLKQWQSANGDSFESVEYHMDLTRTLGITFLCGSRGVTQVWGQNRSLGLQEIFPLERMSDPVNYLRWLYHQLRPGVRSFMENSLLEGIELRDGNSLFAFKRYGRCQQDRSNDLGKVLSEKNLARLVRDESVAILYTHMGKRLQLEGPVIPEEFQEGLRRLEAHFRERKVFVTTTSRLLNYLTVRRELSFVVVKSEDHLRITLKSKTQAEALGGITFYVDSPKRPRFFLGEKELELQENPKDHLQRKSYSVPLTPLSIEKLEPYFKTHVH